MLVAFSPAGDLLAIGTEDGRVRTYDTGDQCHQHQLSLEEYGLNTMTASIVRVWPPQGQSRAWFKWQCCIQWTLS
jgi:WD40 repeat protein